LAQGKSNEEIGIILGIATETVKGHLKPIFARIGRRESHYRRSFRRVTSLLKKS
jgi:ATP/maltotriose-dependent transcriptional regulator MalT